MMLFRLVVVLALVAPTELWAWSRTGHMMVAEIAYRQLSQSEQSFFVEILRHHEDYTEWKGDFHDLEATLSLGEYLFMRASLWPDEIRRSGHRDDHQRWHYINYPLLPPDFSFRPEARKQDNILYAIRKNSRILANRSSSQERKAVAVAWVIHLIGDIHQPLHCAFLIDSAFPRGDRGGTDFYVRPGAKSVTLHAVWDSLLGTRFDPRRARNESIRLMGDLHEDLRNKLRSLGTPESWSLESRLLAVRAAYLKGGLKGVPAEARQQAQGLPGGYTKQALEIAEERVVLAGFRLAGWLSSMANSP